MAEQSRERKKRRLHPTQFLMLGFALLILLGAILLCLPFSAAKGSSVSFLEALFTSASSVCVTGLTVVETGAVYSTFGQLVILLLIQCGGLGIMTITVMFFMMLKKHITLYERMILKEQYNYEGLGGLVNLTKRILIVTLLIELIGACLLSIRFIPIYGWGKGIYFSIFHSVSAFCNAGFDILGNGNSLFALRQEPFILFTLATLITLGGLGFIVLQEIGKERKFSRLSLHAKVVLCVSAILTLSGFILTYLFEIGNPQTLGDPALGTGNAVMGALFQSVSLRTAGYSSLPIGQTHYATKLISIFLMFVGASSGSTGGGIKTTTMFLLLLLVYTVVRGREEVTFAKRTFAMQLVHKAMAIVVVSLILVLCSSLLLCLLEEGNPQTAQYEFIDFLYETTSAFATVGLSCGMTASLSAGSKILIIFMMFVGRIGPLTMAFAISGRKQNKTAVKYPQDRMMIG